MEQKRTRPHALPVLTGAWSGQAVHVAAELGIADMPVLRGRHPAVARETCAEEVRPHPLGCGGGSLELLDELATLTCENTTSMRKLSAPANRAQARAQARARAAAPVNDDGRPYTAGERVASATGRAASTTGRAAS
ncbi:hypothetical protein [Streptomyces sp. 2A115]|uniref:hypothetical protein n=1 Tax=Streptomyces sp. 2A115 TaxID=3457439 RepID=UPI003FD0E8F9